MSALSQKKSAQIRHNLPLKNVAGFTLIELMVVIFIMSLLASAMVLNLNSTRAARDLRIAQNLMVTNLRKAQSYTLSSRTLPTGEQVQYYVLKFDLTNPTQYTIQAVYDVDTVAKLADVETISLPPNIKINSVVVAQRPAIPTVQSAPSTFTSNCALAAFAAPFGKVIFNDGCTPVSFTSPHQLDQLAEDYYTKIVDFQVNVACDPNNYGQPSPICTASTDSEMIITLSDTSGSQKRKILINGITGAICPTNSNPTDPTLTCQVSN
jgi:prepilin-type N-terminal cleavage/methylation domain-containing protein